MKFLSLFSGCGGMDLGLERAGLKCVGQIEIMPYALKVLKKHWPKVPKHTDILTFCVQDGLVKVIQLQVKEKVCNTKEVDSGQRWHDVCEYLSQNGFLERTFSGFYPLMKAETFIKLSPSCRKSGMAFRGEYLTVNTSESPNDAKECSLSDILETSVHPKYYLSKKAVLGMIRRSKKRGRRGYVFLQEMDKNKTRQLKLLSLSKLARLLSLKTTTKRLKEISLLKRSEQRKEAMLPLYGKTLILRKLTPNEKEKLQGLPKDWTLVEEF